MTCHPLLALRASGPSPKPPTSALSTQSFPEVLGRQASGRGQGGGFQKPGHDDGTVTAGPVIGAPCVFPEPSQIAPWAETGLLWSLTQSHPETQPSSLPCLQMGKLRLTPGHQPLWPSLIPGTFSSPNIPAGCAARARDMGEQEAPQLPPMPRAEVPALWAHSVLQTSPLFRSTRGAGMHRGQEGRWLETSPSEAAARLPPGPGGAPASPLCEVAGRGPLPGLQLALGSGQQPQGQ